MPVMCPDERNIVSIELYLYRREGCILSRAPFFAPYNNSENYIRKNDYMKMVSGVNKIQKCFLLLVSFYRNMRKYPVKEYYLTKCEIFLIYR